MCHEEPDSAHPLTKEVLDDGEVMANLVSFATGAPLAQLGELKFILDRLLLIPVSERAAESPHSLMSHAYRCAPNASASYQSLVLRLPQLREELMHSADFVLQLE